MNYIGIYSASVMFLINGETYKADQDLETGIAIENASEMATVVTPNGDTVHYGTSQQSPYTLDFSVVNLSYAMMKLFKTTWEKNQKRDSAYDFTIVFEGINSRGELMKTKFSKCVFRQECLATEIGQGNTAVRMLVNSGKMELL